MKQRKMNTAPWYFLGLAVLLAIGCVVGTTGTSLARYRSEMEEGIIFKARAPEEIYLGQLSGAEEDGTTTFSPTSEAQWETQDGISQLEFAVANGSSDTEYASDDLLVRIRLIGSLGFWDGEDAMMLKLSVPREDDPTQYDVIEAAVARIAAESPLYSTFGDGWVYSFFDEDGKELTWMLEGGKLSYVSIMLTHEGASYTDVNLLQLQLSAETIQN